MKKQYLKPTELDHKIKSLAGREREILSEVIQTIREIDRRKLFLEFGYGNLFAYLTESVGYSAGSAQRRIDAARLANDVPELIQNIESGKIQLSQVSQIQKAIRQVGSSKNLKPTPQEKQAIVHQVLNLLETQSQKHICEYFDLPVLQQQKETIQKDDSIRIEITMNREQYETLKQAQALLSQSTDSQDLATFINYVSQKIIQQKLGKKNLENAKRQPATEQIKINLGQLNTNKDNISDPQIKQFDLDKINAEVISSNNLKTHDPSEIYMSADKLNMNAINNQFQMAVTKQFSSRTRKLVLSKQSGCQYRNPQTGQVCGSRWHLQIDHHHSQWAGGMGTVDNAQILCANHNQFKYRQEASLKMI